MSNRTNSKKVVTLLISKFPPADKTTIAIFSENGIKLQSKQI